MKRLIAAALLASLPLSATAFDAADKAGVEQAAAGYDRAFTSGDMSTVLDLLPPQVVSYLSRQMGGMSLGQMKESMSKQMDVFMADITINELRMDTNRMTSGETSAGRAYAFIPTTVTVTAEGKTRTQRNQTLALEDEGRWYIVRLEQPQQFELVKQVYPDFAGVRQP